MSLESIIAHIDRTPLSPVVIEAGHYYVDQTFSPLGKEDINMATLGASLAGKLKDRLRKPVSLWWFVDELHINLKTQTNNGLNGTEHFDVRKRYRENGFSPHVVVFESEPALQNEALELVSRIPIDRVQKYRKGISLIRGYGLSNYILCERDKHGGLTTPKCSLIDAALYLRKWRVTEEEGICVTILPDVYRDQQATTRLILDSIGFSVPVMSVFFDQDHKITYDANF